LAVSHDILGTGRQKKENEPNGFPERMRERRPGPSGDREVFDP
jgi:hypothetical protein